LILRRRHVTISADEGEELLMAKTLRASHCQEIQDLAFWNWFAEWHSDIAAAYTSGDTFWLDTNLSERVKRIERRLNWEMGPYHDPDHTLVISPSVRENIDLAQRVVAAAPALAGWHFLPAKPPKQLHRLAMELPGVQGADVCGDEWVYRLTSYNQLEFFDIEVFTDYVGPAGDNHLELFTRRLIECLVGEVIYLEKFAAVKVIRGGDARPLAMLSAFPALGRHLGHLLQQDRRRTKG
jgi:hypothetical protein